MGGVPILYQPHGLMEALGQGNALRQAMVQAHYQPQQLQNQNALQQQQIALGNYQVQNAPTAIENQNALAKLQIDTGKDNLLYGSGQYGQILRALQNPNLTQEQKNSLNNALFMTSSWPSGLPNTPLTQGLLTTALESNPSMKQSYVDATGQTPSQVYGMQNTQYQSQTGKNQGQANFYNSEADIGIPATAADKLSGANKTNTEAVNEGGINPGITASVSALQNQLQSMQAAQQQKAQTLPQGNFSLWKPNQQDSYIQDNNTPPPLPPNTAITKDIDAKTQARINGLPATAQGIQFMQDGLNNPEITQYMGNSASARTKRGMAAAAAMIGQTPQAYSEYLSFQKNAQALIADTIATTQTGSRSYGMMQQFQKVFDPGSQVTLDQAKQSLMNAGNILYDEGKTYVGSPYEPGLRNAAYNGVKILNNLGYGAQGDQSSQNSSQPPSGMSKEQFMQWQQSQGGNQ